MPLTFQAIRQENRTAFDCLMLQYSAELDSRSGNMPPPEFIQKWIDSIIRLQMQGDSDRHLEYCFDGDTLIGFLYGKIDHPQHRGYKKIGYGYVMEFFVLPEYRRNGYGKAMFLRLQSLFAVDGAKKLYLTTDSAEGDIFWKKMGFVPTGEISPDNGDPVYEKEIVT